MNEKKVLVEQSVLVAASVSCFVEDIGVTIKDDFHDMSKSLFDYVKKNVDNEIGIITDFIIEQTEEILSQIIMRKMQEKSEEGEIERKKLYESFSYILSECIREMKTNVKYLLRVPVNQKEVEKIMVDVFKFYQETRHKISRLDPAYEVSVKAKRASIAISKVCPIPEVWESIFHDEKNNDFKAFSKLSNKFLVGGQGPDISDKKILSECIHLRKRYRKKGNIDFFLASTDQHFVKIRNVNSEMCSIVPSEIEKKFKIICKWPDEILETA